MKALNKHFYLTILTTFIAACSGDYPNPIADKHANEVREKCKLAPSITINRPISADGILFYGSEFTNPKEELLRRRLTFLETQAPGQTKVTRYFLSDFESDECKEFRYDAKRYPFVLIPLRRLGLPETLCVASKQDSKPQSKYFYSYSYTSTPVQFGYDWTNEIALIDRYSGEKVANTIDFGYCDTPMCWHGFACRHGKQRREILEIVTGIPDQRLGAVPSVTVLPNEPFVRQRTAKLKLMGESKPDSSQIPAHLNLGRSGEVTSNGKVYLVEHYVAKEPAGSFSLDGYDIEIVNGERIIRRYVRAFDSTYSSFSLLTYTNGEIRFFATYGDWGKLKDIFFRYSSNLDQLEAVSLDLGDFPIRQEKEFRYYISSASYINNKLSIAVLETKEGGANRPREVTNTYQFSE